SSGLDALRLSLLAAGVGPGDEVITATNTFIATALAVTSVGAKVVLVEPDEATHNITAEGIARAIAPRTKALLPVHLYGLPVEIGYNHRLDEVQAAVLRIKLKKLERYNRLRGEHAAYYSRALSGLPVTCPTVPADRTHIFHLYVLRSTSRDKLQAHLADKGIG